LPLQQKAEIQPPPASNSSCSVNTESKEQQERTGDKLGKPTTSCGGYDENNSDRPPNLGIDSLRRIVVVAVDDDIDILPSTARSIF
jgi:hypothetical protein